MIDLTSLRTSPYFDNDPNSVTRIALVHRSFRSVSVRRSLERSVFSSHFPALGLLNLAHSIRQDAAQNRYREPEIRYFDEEAFFDETHLAANVESWLAPAKRRIIGASTYTSTIDRLEDFFALFEPDRYLIIAGGAHATTAPDIQGAHIVVRGEGGNAMRCILTDFFNDRFVETQADCGLNFLLDGKKFTSVAKFDKSIESLPSPMFAYDLLPQETEIGRVYATNFKRSLGKRPMIYICTQSCRARCSFCSTYLIHGKSVSRPISKVRMDLEHLLSSYDYDSLEFHDDDLFQHPELIKLMELMVDLSVPWFCYGRAEAVTKTNAIQLADAGCKRVFLGIEAMDQETLDYFHKKTTVEQNRAAIQYLEDAGIGVLAGFIIGAPHHTIESVLETLDQFLEMRLLGINVSILSPDPGTLEFNRARKADTNFELVSSGKSGSLRLTPNTELFGIETPIGLPSVCKHVSKTDLNILVKLIEVEFYLRPQVEKRYLCESQSHDERAIHAFFDFQRKQRERLLEQCECGTLNPLIAKRLSGNTAIWRH